MKRRQSSSRTSRTPVSNSVVKATGKTNQQELSMINQEEGNIRVRMYRVGFGDFFLLTVPGKNGPAHILIDCGVHAGNLGSMDECIKNLKKETNNKLALVILTHAHADHLSGFDSNAKDFADFEVGAVWMPNRLDPSHLKFSKFMAQLTSVAGQLQLHLGAREDEAGRQAQHKVENALGVDGSNDRALKLLQSGGFKSRASVFYYQADEIPQLPDELEGRITAEILGPAPKESAGIYADSDNKTEQYLAAVGEDGDFNLEQVKPFEKEWPASPEDYPRETFTEFQQGFTGMKSILESMQPDVLLAAADKLDGTLNNQSLVILFTCQGKKLLFVGDAQWGNWAYWLYGKPVKGEDPGINARARAILSSVDFYKVGHHGSTNATPIPAVGALNPNCVSMCSTATGAYGDPKKKTEVPRTALIDALKTRTHYPPVRSDWIAIGDHKADPQALAEMSELPPGFSSGPLYIDYNVQPGRTMSSKTG